MTEEVGGGGVKNVSICVTSFMIYHSQFDALGTFFVSKSFQRIGSNFLIFFGS